MCVKVFAAEEVEWSRFGLTLDGEPITAILTHAELKSGMELEWLWDVRDLEFTTHTLEGIVYYWSGEEERSVRATRVFDLSPAAEGSANTAAEENPNTAVQTWTMVQLRWLEPLVFLLLPCLCSCVILQCLRHPRRVLFFDTPSHVTASIQRLRKNSVLFSLFFVASVSLLGGVYVFGFHQGVLMISFLWGTLTYSAHTGWEYFFWCDITMWSAWMSVCVILLMFVYCLLRIESQRSLCCRRMARACVSISTVFTLVQVTLFVSNFPLSVSLCSWNMVWLPILTIVVSLRECGKQEQKSPYHAV